MNEPEQRSLFNVPTEREPVVESWAKVVARRMQSIVMGYPVHQMVAKGESGYYPDWQEQNFTFLALQVFDSVFARMAPGIGEGATREEIIHDLTPFILARQPDLPPERVEEMVDFVLNHLLNEGKGSFEQECIWLDEGNRPKPYTFRYGLLRSYHHPETDRFIIRATTEAIHIFLRMLDQPLEDEQLSNLFILHEQVRTGRIDRTRQEVERTMLLSLEYERYIEDMLRAIHRDVRSVDWLKEVTPRIEEAHQHVRRLIREQGRVLRDLKQELQVNEDRLRIKSIHELIDVLELCQRRHMELERRILKAGPAYLEEQAWQRFRGMARSPMPALNERVFFPSLSLEEPFWLEALPELFHHVLGPGIHKMMDLDVLIERLLRDEEVFDPGLGNEEDEQRVPVSELYNPLADAAEEKIADLIASLGEQPVRLSEILAACREEGLERDDLALIGVSFLQSYHARSDLLGILVKTDGEPLEDPEFSGDDLLIRIHPDTSDSSLLE